MDGELVTPITPKTRRSSARNQRWTPDVVRARIQTGVILQRLQDQFLGKLELTELQVRVGLGLLRKVVPDLSSSDGQVNHQLRVIIDRSCGQLVNQALTSLPLRTFEHEPAVITEQASASVPEPT